jgi:NhaA family Na+:H+ antiporter
VDALIQRFLRLEASGGIILFIAAVLAVVADNSPAASLYDAFRDLPLGVRLGDIGLEKPLLFWINDGLMAVFFLLVGLEIKREVLEGELSSPAQIALPAGAAAAGMIVPAIIYGSLNFHDEVAFHGWAISSATDIAFALGVLSLAGSRIPVSLKVFLTAVAVLDDLGAIVIIAIAYTSDLSFLSLCAAGIAMIALAALNRRGVSSLAPYLLVGVVLWVFVLKSGVHATLAGVAVGLAIPLRSSRTGDESPLRSLEHGLHPWVVFGILPIFAFANAGLSLNGLGIDRLFTPIPLGIALGLFFGKQIGVFGAVGLMVASGLARLPAETSWRALYGTALLCGIGFTMSLFIGSLAFEDPAYAVDVRLGVITGSILSALAGYAVLRTIPPPSAPTR